MKVNALLPCLFVFCLIETGLFFLVKNIGLESYRFYDWNRPQLHESLVQWQVYNVLTSDKDADLVFIGDSSCVMGVMPKNLTSDTGYVTKNIGTIGWMYTDGYAKVLDLYLQRRSPERYPKLVIWYTTPMPFSLRRADIDEQGVLKRFREWITLMEFFQRQELSWNMVKTLVLPSLVFRQMFPSLIGEAIGDYWVDKRRSWQPSDSEVRSLLKDNFGFIRDLSPHKDTRVSFIEKPEISDDAIPGVREFFGIAEAHKVPVLVMMNPQMEASNNTQTREAFMRFETHVRAIAKPYRFVKVHAPLLRFYPNEYFSTTTHLNPLGAEVNSRDLGQIIKNELD